MTNRTPRAARRVAFTLMEVLVVVAILVILAGVGGVIMLRYLDEAKIDKAKIDIKSLEQVVETYKLKNGDYPATLAILAEPQDQMAAYVEVSALIDPWGREYVLDTNTINPRTGRPLVYSQGPNLGDPNGAIRNWTN